MTQQKSQEKHSYHHGDLKQALLDETARILREEGENALSLRRLATNLNVSRTAPYNHFKNKESLLNGVAEEGFRRFNKTMKQVRSRYRDHDGEAFTKAVVKAYVKFARQNREYYDLMYSRKTWGSANAKGTLSGVARETLRNDVERLKRSQKLGLIARDIDVLQFTQLYWGTLHGISRLLLDGVYTDAASLNKLCESAALMLWQQLSPD